MSRTTDRLVAVARDLAANGFDQLDDDTIDSATMPEPAAIYDTTKFFEFQDPAIIEAQNRRDLIKGYNPIDGTVLTRSQHSILLDQIDPPLTYDERRDVANDRMIEDDLDVDMYMSRGESAWQKHPSSGTAHSNSFD